MDRYAVVGNPVAHSLSPRIHHAFAAETGQTLRYEKLPVAVDGFVEAVTAFFAAGGAGLNVTVPFKEAAARWVTELDPVAGAAGAVNTIVRTRAGFRGHNTDGAGLVRDLVCNCGLAVAGARVLLLGAGGAARGVAGALLAERPRALVIANRTESRAAALADLLTRQWPGADVGSTPLAAVQPGFDLIVNATSAGLGSAAAVPAIAPRALASAACYDLSYGAAGERGDTAFCRWAGGHGARRVLDGLGMLVEQAALAFELWRGVRPATLPVLERLRSERV